MIKICSELPEGDFRLNDSLPAQITPEIIIDDPLYPLTRDDDGKCRVERKAYATKDDLIIATIYVAINATVVTSNEYISIECIVFPGGF